MTNPIETILLELIGKNDKRAYEPADNYKTNCRNQLRQELRAKLPQVVKAIEEEMGRQFYERFRYELGMSAATRTEVVLKAAKRAANISDTGGRNRWA